MASDTPAYRTPGALIRTAREARGLTLEDLSSETRIPDRLLAAMEADDFDQLSGALYARSFLRNCAQALNLEPATLLDAYERMLTEADPEVPADQTWETETEVQRLGAVPWKTVGLGAAGLLALALLVWGGIALFGGGDESGEPAPTEVADAGPGLEAAETDAGAATTGPGTVSADPERPDPADGDGTPPADEPPADEPRSTDDVLAVPAEPAAETDDAPALPEGDARLVFAGGETWPLVLRVVLEGRADLSVGRDGDPRPVSWPDRPVYGVPSEGVEPGRLYTVSGRHVAYWGAADHFVLELSRAEGVTVSLNGRVLDVPDRIVGREWVLDRTRLAP